MKKDKSLAVLAYHKPSGRIKKSIAMPKRMVIDSLVSILSRMGTDNNIDIHVKGEK